MVVVTKYKNLFGFDKPMLWVANGLDLIDQASRAVQLTSLEEFVRLAHLNIMRTVSRDDYAPPKLKNLNFYFAEPEAPCRYIIRENIVFFQIIDETDFSLD